MVEAEYLQQEGVFARDEMALDDFGDFLERFNHFRIFVGLRERDAYEGAYIQPQCLRLYEEA